MKAILKIIKATLISIMTGGLLLVTVGKDFNFWLTATLTFILVGLGIYLIYTNKKILGIGILVGSSIHTLVWIFLMWTLYRTNGW
jgi:hypothetical protein